MNDLSLHELVILRGAMQDRMAVVEKLANELGTNLASKILLDDYRCLQCKIMETLQRKINELG